LIAGELSPASELKQRALELVAGGASWSQAAREVGVHKQTVGAWVKAQRR
jgi:transposase-like protein